jgi:23S rRNA (guanosine2251-2'-O)-methyltransferase
MGSEDKGIHPTILKVCDERFKIPMYKDFESLNVSVAAGMILYEAMRQRLVI